MQFQKHRRIVRIDCYAVAAVNVPGTVFQPLVVSPTDKLLVWLTSRQP